MSNLKSLDDEAAMASEQLGAQLKPSSLDNANNIETDANATRTLKAEKHIDLAAEADAQNANNAAPAPPPEPEKHVELAQEKTNTEKQSKAFAR